MYIRASCGYSSLDCLIYRRISFEKGLQINNRKQSCSLMLLFSSSKLFRQGRVMGGKVLDRSDINLVQQIECTESWVVSWTCAISLVDIAIEKQILSFSSILRCQSTLSLVYLFFRFTLYLPESQRGGGLELKAGFIYITIYVMSIMQSVYGLIRIKRRHKRLHGTTRDTTILVGTSSAVRKLSVTSLPSKKALLEKFPRGMSPSRTEGQGGRLYNLSPTHQIQFGDISNWLRLSELPDSQRRLSSQRREENINAHST